MSSSSRNSFIPEFIPDEVIEYVTTYEKLHSYNQEEGVFWLIVANFCIWTLLLATAAAGVLK